MACEVSAVMMSSKSGVTKLMKQKFPSLIVRNRADHGLKLAVGDMVKSVNSIDIFKYKILCENFLDIKPQKFVRILGKQ
jgi:hypothetical protein